MIKGIDISHHNYDNKSPIDFSKVKAAGYEFCFIKATEGTTFEDPYFLRSANECVKNGILWGGYHFLRASESALAQAEFFMDSFDSNSLNPTLPYVLDIETLDGMEPADVKQNAITWLQYVQSITGKTPLIYININFTEQLGFPKEFKNYPLWLAEYGVLHPKVNPPWDKWTFWQNSEDSTVSGVDGYCDTDYFDGELSDLQV